MSEPIPTRPAPVSRPLVIALAAAIGLSCPLDADAVNARPMGSPDAPPTFEDYVGDLGDSRPAVRRFAVVELQKRVRQAVRQSSRPDEVGTESMLFLEDADRLLAPRCIDFIETENLRVGCARILVMLETDGAAVAIERARALEDRRGAARKLDALLLEAREQGA